MQADTVTKDALARVKLDEAWKYPLADMLLSDTMSSLRSFLAEQQKQQKVIY